MSERNRGALGARDDPSLPIGGEASIPNPALSALSFLVGRWQTEGTHPDLPGKTFHGRASFEWSLGGAFLLMRTEIVEPEIPSGAAVFGSDDDAERVYLMYFDERAVSRMFNVVLGHDQVVCRRDHPRFSQIMTIRAAGSDTLISSSRRSEGGAPWQDDLSLRFERL